MPDEITIPASTLYGFLLVFTRIAGVFTFVPLPGFKSGVDIAKIFMSVSLTLALYPRWPVVNMGAADAGMLIGWALSEAALGITVGLLVAFITESFLIGAQILSLPAGYTYASTVDPATQAESNVLLILAQLTAGLLFFAFGFDRQVLLILAQSLDSYPPGTFLVTRPLAERIIQLGAGIFVVGFRLVLPAVALLVLVDIALALLGRLNTQLQVMALALPAKMLTSLVVLALMSVLLPRVFVQSGNQIMLAIHRTLHP